MPNMNNKTTHKFDKNYKEIMTLLFRRLFNFYLAFFFFEKQKYIHL